MRFSPLFVLLFLVSLASQAQEQKRVAILNTEDDGEPEIEFTNLNFLTGKLREIAVKVLPEDKYSVMSVQSIIDKMGSRENARKMCKEAQCLAQIGRQVSAAYVGQARLGRLDDYITINMELYNAGSGVLIGSFTGKATKVSGLESVIIENAPQMFGKMPGASVASKAAPTASSVAGGIGGVQVKGTDYEFTGEKRYLANISSDPEGASLSFNGVPDTRCKTTPCSVELGEGNIRIIAALEQYDMADTTVSIKQNNQSIRIRMKANFGVLEIKPAFLDGIGKDERWSLAINGKAASSWENRLSPNKYKVELSHRCYEDLSFDVGINRDKREVFDMASYVKLKKGGLVLNAERDGKPVSEMVYVNGVQVGETPFSGSVAVCARVEIGSGREKVDVNLKHNDKVVHTVKSNTNKSSTFATPVASVTITSIIKDPRDNNTYNVVRIGNQTWMAENLNYNASGSKCYDNNPTNCDKYGRLYNWETAKTICPSGWHLPSDVEWTVLTEFVGGSSTAGTKLKTKNGWNNGGNGDDKFGFSALPGAHGNSYGFRNIGNSGIWWSSTESTSDYAIYRDIYYNNESVSRQHYYKNSLYSVRCLKDM
ncbi:MAG: PEGA domain-containing protein [Fibromonadaceae bacterium]|jgi:uncharacterized protein (TIGR02145 family)|nr:PEGA domain-containing protein [Fibromonadaceae bacterium]